VLCSLEARSMPETIENAAYSLSRSGVLTARPEETDLSRSTDEAARTGSAAGLHRLGLNGARDGLVYIPRGYRPQVAAPLVLLLHGAGAAASDIMPRLTALADKYGLIVLAPDSRRSTWDLILANYGADVAFIDQALRPVFSRFRVDPEHIAIAGFSDGASYALSLGIVNGGLFTNVIAFSPGFAAEEERSGAPRIFVSHGVEDTVLPIGRCSRPIVTRLRQAGYAVVYHEFDGRHSIPPGMAERAMEWFLGLAH
jgi:phospholipase/carboxylesterase